MFYYDLAFICANKDFEVIRQKNEEAVKPLLEADYTEETDCNDIDCRAFFWYYMGSGKLRNTEKAFKELADRGEGSGYFTVSIPQNEEYGEGEIGEYAPMRIVTGIDWS